MGLASDGLWDQLTLKDVADIAKSTSPASRVAESLVEKAFTKAAMTMDTPMDLAEMSQQDRGKTLQQMLGKGSRKYIDDTTQL